MPRLAKLDSLWYSDGLVNLGKHVNNKKIYFWFTYDLNKSTKQSKLDTTGDRTFDIHIIDSTFHIPEVLTLSVRPSGTSACFTCGLLFKSQRR